MKLNNDFLLHNTGDQALLVPVAGADFSGVVQGNKTLGVILELLQNDISEEELVRTMEERFDAPEGAIQRDVEHALRELRKIGALDG